jgi:hypothetical protein
MTDLKLTYVFHGTAEELRVAVLKLIEKSLAGISPLERPKRDKIYNDGQRSALEALQRTIEAIEVR